MCVHFLFLFKPGDSIRYELMRTCMRYLINIIAVL